MKRAPSFTLSNTWFPRDIGNMILQWVVGPLGTTNEILSFLSCRMVCRIWHTFLPRSMLTRTNGAAERVIDSVYSSDHDFISMAQQLINWNYPIWYACEEIAAFKYTIGIFVQAYRRAKPEHLRWSMIWKSALKSGNGEIMSYMCPVIIIQNHARTAFDFALSYARDAKTFKYAIKLLPKQHSIPCVGSIRTFVVDVLFEEFGMDRIVEWQLSMINNQQYGIVQQTILHFNACSEYICRRLDYNLYHDEFHKSIGNVCHCGKYATHRRSKRIKNGGC
jgi:hypothetical protein